MKIKRATVEAVDGTGQTWEVEATVVVGARSAEEALAEVALALREER